MAAKKKSIDQGSRGMNSKGKTVKWLPVSTKPKESFSQGGGPVPKVPKRSVKTTSMPAPKTPVKKAGSGFAGSGGPLASGFKKITKGDIAKTAVSVAGLGAATGAKIVTKTVVSEATKKLQRELSRELKEQSGKGLTKQQRQVRGEQMSEMSPEDYLDSTVGEIQRLRRSVSESMRSTNKTKKQIRIPKKR